MISRKVNDMPDKVIEAFYQNRNQKRARYMVAYMKDKFPFLGIPKPERAALQHDFFSQARRAAVIDWKFVVRVWDLPEREFQHLGVDYLLALKKCLLRDDIEKIEALIINKSWWDTVDGLATIAGVLCSLYPELIESHIVRWSESDNIWLVRVAILFQLKYREKTDTELLSRIIRKNSTTREFFVNKAIGWALREYSKTDKAWVKAFIESSSLHSLSVREGSKYI